MTFCQISGPKGDFIGPQRICATILPIDPPENPKGMYDPQDLDSNTKVKLKTEMIFGMNTDTMTIGGSSTHNAKKYRSHQKTSECVIFAIIHM